ncbi:MAG TPA: glycosyltransferase family 92 protein [Azospirillaceae bacterium]|nr:glycosyltransferase family 92 protein [Azospirillaceae bacterium]
MIYGHFDCVTGRAVCGWAWDAERPGVAISIEVQVDGTTVVAGAANLYRPDLQDAGIADGCHSYALLLPETVMDGREHDITVLGDGIPLLGTPSRQVLPDLRFVPLPADDRAYPVELAICAIAKNEARYLREWVAFHRLVGVEHFLIFDNDSTDRTPALLAEIAAEGFLDWMPWPSQPGTPPQLAAYGEGLRRLRDRCRWIAFIDLDEFLVPLEGTDVKPILRDYQTAGGLAVPWRIYGSSGLHEDDGRLVLSRFTRRAADDDPVNGTVKTVVRGTYASAPGVHVPQLSAGRIVDEHRRVVGALGDPDRHAVPDARRLVLRHYFCKSWAEWENKRNRGIATAEPGAASHIRPDSHFQAHDRNEIHDPMPEAFLQGMAEQMRR